MRIIDAHAHLARGAAASNALLASMDALGIERTVVVAGGTIAPGLLSDHIENGGGTDVDVDNAALYAACEDARFRLLPFYFANPHRGDVLYAREGAAFVGLKLAPAVHGIPFNDERTEALVAQAEELGHPIYLHCLPRAGFTVKDFAFLASEYPRVRFILGHAGVGTCDFGAVERIRPLENVWFEMSGGFTSVCKAAVRALGADRVLFGTEYPLQDPRVELAKLDTLELTDHEWERITRTNILELVDMERLRCAA
mgnify:CR=1 FL=1